MDIPERKRLLAAALRKSASSYKTIELQQAMCPLKQSWGDPAISKQNVKVDHELAAFPSGEDPPAPAALSQQAEARRVAPRAETLQSSTTAADKKDTFFQDYRSRTGQLLRNIADEEELGRQRAAQQAKQQLERVFFELQQSKADDLGPQLQQQPGQHQNEPHQQHDERPGVAVVSVAPVQVSARLSVSMPMPQAASIPTPVDVSDFHPRPPTV